MRRIVLGAFALVLIAVPGTGGSPTPAPAAAATTAAAACTDALLVAVPGAAQGGAGDAGPTLGRLASRLVARAGADSRTVTTRVVAAGTAGPAALRGRGSRRTAASRAVTRAAWRQWRAPVAELRTQLADVVGEAAAACPDQLVYLVGQAQGAEAVHWLVARADGRLQSRTAGVVLVADPARVSGSGGPLMGAPRARRSARGVTTRFSRRTTAVPEGSWHPPTYSVCTAGDLVCDLRGNQLRSALQAHRSYAAAPAARRLARIGRRLGARAALWPRPDTGQTVTGQVGELMPGEELAVQVAPSARRSLRFGAVAGLPPGLQLTRSGSLRGMPTQAGTWRLRYWVRNPAGPSVSRKMPGELAVTVEPGAAAAVSAGGRHGCEIRTSGSLWCWGANGYGQLGVGDERSGESPRRVGTASDWAHVSAGGMHTCGIRDGGSLWCWGLNYRGQLGIGSRTDQTAPRRIGRARDWVSVSAGWVHTCATRQDGTAWCWGDNDHGQLGNGGRTDARRPKAVTGQRAWQEVRAGGWHTCGVTRSGEAWCWGRNSRGQLGDGTDTLRINPARVGSGSGWATVAPAWTHTCALSQDGRASCWGGNEGSQLGGGGFDGWRTPREVAPGRTWSALDTGVNFSCALDLNDAPWCWGTGRSGQLDGGPTSEEPVRVREGSTFAQMDVGWLFACGLEGGGGRPSCWGNDDTGETGPPTPRSSSRGTSGQGFSFTLATFNVLGSNHTTPRSNAGEFSPARVRTEWTVDHLRSIDAGVVGFQELQRDQLGWFKTAAGPTYSTWPGTSQRGKGLQTTIAWQRKDWAFVSGDLVTIPFISQQRHMPLVRLRHLGTGRHIWVMNVHNAPRGYQEQRNEAVRREIARLKSVVGRGDPVFLVGDFNERQRAFCEVTGKLGFVAPRGGSHTGRCRPPQGFTRIDWIFGSDDVDYSHYREDKTPLVRLTTDHAVLRTRVSVP